MRRRAVLLAVALAAALLPAPAAVAKTGVTVDGTVVTFHVPIDVHGMADRTFRFRDPETGEFTVDAEAAARLFEDDANALWNDQLADLPFLDCFTFRIDIDLNPVPRGHRSEEGRHTIGYQREPTFRSYVNFPPGAGATGDSSTLYQGPVNGEWFMGDVAHEAGHLLGLDDDYIDVGGTYRDVRSIPKPGREGTIMAGGEVVDQNLVDRLGELVGEVEDLPECWTGTMHSETERVYTTDPDITHTCTDAWDTEIRLVVADDGTVTGDAMARLSEGPACSFPDPVFPPFTEVALSLRGTANSDGFQLRVRGPTGGISYAGFSANFAPWGGGVTQASEGQILEIRKTEPCTADTVGIAEGTVTVEDTFPAGPYDTFTSVNTIELVCAT